MIEKVASSAARFSTTLLYFSSVPVCLPACLSATSDDCYPHRNIFSRIFLQKKVILIPIDLTQNTQKNSTEFITFFALVSKMGQIEKKQARKGFRPISAM